jgi:hypothetical protein
MPILPLSFFTISSALPVQNDRRFGHYFYYFIFFKKKKRRKSRVALGQNGVVEPPITKGLRGGRSHPMPLEVVQPPPKYQNPLFLSLFFFFFFLAFWGGQTTPFAMGLVRTTPIPAMRVAPATPLAKMGWPRFSPSSSSSSSFNIVF